MDSPELALPAGALGTEKGVFRTIWKTWKRVGQVIGDLLARVALSLFYFTVFAPFALGVRLLSDPMGLRPKSDAARWLQRSTTNQTCDDARRQF
jgi:hypothetical protein